MTKISVLVCSEDGGKHGHDVVAAIAKKLFTRIVSGCQTQNIKFNQLSGPARAVMTGNRWKGDEAGRRRVVRAVATAIAKGDIVVIHVDGDTTWTRRANSQNVALASTKLIQVAEENARETMNRNDGKESIQGAALLFAPFYSIEAWLYCNSSILRRLVHEGKVQGLAFSQVENWTRTLGSLDEVKRLKTESSYGSKWNLRLAQEAFPIEDAIEASPSLQYTLSEWSDVKELVSLLTQTLQSTI